jgi:GxxExxY protein
MPIHLSAPIRVVTQDEYHATDRVMLGHAFEIHNQYGRLLDEAFYKKELAWRCKKAGLAVARELLIQVQHGDFHKDYFLDMLLDDSTIVEAKCTQAIASAHRGQTLNYLLLCGTHHGSLLNFRPFKVQREFISTQLTHALLREFTVSRHNWPADTAYQVLTHVACDFCTDVGLGLDLTLYRQAFATLVGGHCVEPQSVAVFSGERVVHEHAMYLVTEDVGLVVTALAELHNTRQHLQRLLDNTRLAGIAWINLPLHELRFEFLSRQNHRG